MSPESRLDAPCPARAWWVIDIDCPACAGPLEHVNHTTNGVLAVTVAACPSCRKQWELTVRMTPMAWTPEEIKDRYRLCKTAEIPTGETVLSTSGPQAERRTVRT